MIRYDTMPYIYEYFTYIKRTLSFFFFFVWNRFERFTHTVPTCIIIINYYYIAYARGDVMFM